MTRCALILAAGMSLLVGAVLAQPPATPTDAKVQPIVPPAPTAAAPPKSQPDGYPPYVTKTLWATNDLRGKAAPKLQVEQWIGGKEPDTKNKTVLVDFWATWCAPCRALIPELEAWQAKYKDDLLVIGITNETAEHVANFVDLRGAEVKYTLARDTQSRANKEVGVQGLPHALIISSDGIVRWQGFPQERGEVLTEETLKRIIDADKAARAKRAGTPAVPPSETKKDIKPADPKPPEAKPEDKKPAGK